MPGLPPLKKADAQRYASLQHPGDAYAYDIFSKAGQAARSASILGGLKAKHVLAAGESQSAGFLTTYVNTVGRSGKIFDGYLIHRSEEHTSELQSLMRSSYAVFCLKYKLR